MNIKPHFFGMVIFGAFLAGAMLFSSVHSSMGQRVQPSTEVPGRFQAHFENARAVGAQGIATYVFDTKTGDLWVNLGGKDNWMYLGSPDNTPIHK